MTGKTVDPTPEEIREACLEIQATWTPEEEMRRRGIRAYAPYEIRRTKVVDND